ncbi:cytochrome c oxidase assembly protein [Pseudopontixanthobacter vadosimaris]|uniref:cytochrome c oxidase assembly protein n=1 Tax=Pseudopontixanthobacter vadosimaris TaxID=2726450 RepID=UPI001472C542|nr:cytochrome c oxidase assembly protein [Pseudopontixanthobacter vadosimaris]
MPDWLPYCGQAPLPAEWLARWNFDPVLIAALLLAGLAAVQWRTELRPRAMAAAGGIAAFLYISPFCALGSALFTIRIVHDVILVAALAPLLVAALKLEQRSIPGSLWVWTALHAITFWLWHAPPLYEAAMSSDAIFWAMQASLTGTAAVLWAKIIRAPAPAAAAMLLATMVAMGALGALLTFAHRPLYAVHWLTTQSWGLSALEDQQIAGIVMWAPASLVYLLAALTILYRSFGREVAA